MSKTKLDMTAKLGRITHNNGNFAVQGHLRSPILVPIESSYTASYIKTIARQVLRINSGIYESARNLYLGRRAVPLQTFTTRHSIRKLYMSYGFVNHFYAIRSGNYQIP